MELKDAREGAAEMERYDASVKMRCHFLGVKVDALRDAMQDVAEMTSMSDWINAVDTLEQMQRRVVAIQREIRTLDMRVRQAMRCEQAMFGPES